MIRFVMSEDGIDYLVTNYRKYKGRIQVKPDGCWKWPLKKKA